MESPGFCDLPAYRMVELIRSGEATPVQLVNQHLEHIASLDEKYCSFATLADAAARILAEKSEKVLSDGNNAGLLHGIPIAVDDLLDVANLRSTFGSKACSERVPEWDSSPVQALKEAGAIVLGKLAVSEFGTIPATVQSGEFGQSIWGDQYVVVGGSYGMCTAVAKGFVPAAVGVDFNANVMLPGAFAGIYVMRPTAGEATQDFLSRPAVAARSARDLALLVDVLSNRNERVPNVSASLDRSIRSLRVAVYPNLWNASIDDAHRLALEQVTTHLNKQKCRLEEKRPDIQNPIDAWELICQSELYANWHELFETEAELLDMRTRNMFSQARLLSAKEYLDARKQIQGTRKLLEMFFEHFDVLIVPAAGCLPFEYGGTPSNCRESETHPRWQEYASMCAIAAISDYPVALLPVAKSDRQELPACMLVIAPPGCDDLILAVCADYEQAHQTNSSR